MLIQNRKLKLDGPEWACMPEIGKNGQKCPKIVIFDGFFLLQKVLYSNFLLFELNLQTLANFLKKIFFKILRDFWADRPKIAPFR